MALGRVSAFQKLEKSGAGSGSSRENVGNSALESPFASLGAADFTGGAGGANSSSANTSGITGGDPSLASMAAAVGTLGVPGLGAVTGPLGMSLAGPIGGLIGGLGGNIAGAKAADLALSAVPNSLTSENSPVSFTGNTGLMGSTGLGGVLGNILGSLGVPGFTAPTFSFTTPNQFGAFPSNADALGNIGATSPNVGPAMGFSSGMAAHGIGTGSTFSGPNAAPGMFGDISMGGLRGAGQGPAVATGAGTGNASPGSTNFGGPAVSARGGGGDDPEGNPDTSGPTPTEGDPTGQEGGTSGNGPTGTVGDGTAGGIGGSAPGGEGGSAGNSGDGSAGVGVGDGSGGVFHEGGFVDLERGGQGVDDNAAPGQESDSQGGDTITAQDGEFVVNKEAAGRFGPLLNQLNQLGRNKQLQEWLGAILEGAAKTGFGALGR